MARTGYLVAAWGTGAAAVVGLGVLWWAHRYDEPFGEPDLTGRVVKVDPPARPGYFGRGSWHAVVVPDAGPSRRVSLTVRRETPVRGADGTLAVQTRFVSVVADP